MTNFINNIRRLLADNNLAAAVTQLRLSIHPFFIWRRLSFFMLFLMLGTFFRAEANVTQEKNKFVITEKKQRLSFYFSNKGALRAKLIVEETVVSKKERKQTFTSRFSLTKIPVFERF